MLALADLVIFIVHLEFLEVLDLEDGDSGILSPDKQIRETESSYIGLDWKLVLRDLIPARLVWLQGKDLDQVVVAEGDEDPKFLYPGYQTNGRIMGANYHAVLGISHVNQDDVSGGQPREHEPVRIHVTGQHRVPEEELPLLLQPPGGCALNRVDPGIAIPADCDKSLASSVVGVPDDLLDGVGGVVGLPLHLDETAAITTVATGHLNC